jgi:hypothetical protein
MNLRPVPGSRPAASVLLCVLVAVSLAAAGCSADVPLVTRTSLRVSDNSRIAARTILAEVASSYPNVVEHLALAEEVYQKQLDFLRRRRLDLRARRRGLGVGAYVTFAVTSLAIGALAIASTSSSSPRDSLEGAGVGALAGLGVGTTLEVVNYLQEDPSAMDDKMHHLQSSYDGMLARIQLILARPAAAGEGAAVEREIGSIIESFLNDAMQLNVRG